MKKVLALAAFAFVSLASTSAHAQSTISPVPGAPDAPHQTTPTIAPDQQITGQRRSDGQMMPDNRAQKGQKMRKGNHSPEGKEARKQTRMQKNAPVPAGTM